MRWTTHLPLRRCCCCCCDGCGSILPSCASQLTRSAPNPALPCCARRRDQTPPGSAKLSPLPSPIVRMRASGVGGKGAFLRYKLYCTANLTRWVDLNILSILDRTPHGPHAPARRARIRERDRTIQRISPRSRTRTPPNRKNDESGIDSRKVQAGVRVESNTA